MNSLKFSQEFSKFLIWSLLKMKELMSALKWCRRFWAHLKGPLTLLTFNDLGKKKKYRAGEEGNIPRKDSERPKWKSLIYEKKLGYSLIFTNLREALKCSVSAWMWIQTIKLSEVQFSWKLLLRWNITRVFFFFLLVYIVFLPKMALMRHHRYSRKALRDVILSKGGC